MTESEAQDWLRDRAGVSRETFVLLHRFTELLREEQSRQNLVAASTLDHLWARHIVDSAQLLAHFPQNTRTCADLGAGAGFPGMVLALIGPARVTLIESRRLRVDFLRRAVVALGLVDRVEIIADRAERLQGRAFDVLTARAFAPLDRLFPIGLGFAAPNTRWLLPKGRNAIAELDAARRSWQGAFHILPSVTDAEAGILVAEQVQRRRSA